MMTEPTRLHTGHALPGELAGTIANWDQDDVTPGWLDSLPETVAELCATWRIEIERVVPGTYVTAVILGHSATLGPVVIKSSPLAEEFVAEATAIRLAAADNVARLLVEDLPRSVMVIERITPGTQLREVEMSDEAATRLAAETVASMWRDVPDAAGLHPLRRWMRALFEWTPQPERVPQALIEQAQALGDELLARSTRSRLLHGDFQHHNLLRRENGEWAIIDPKGLYGDPGFEIAAWMYNPPHTTVRDDYVDLAARRLAIFAEVWNMDRRDLTAWAFAGSVLSVCWASADSAPNEWSRAFLAGAQKLQTLLH